MADNIVHANMLFYTLHYDIMNLRSLKITKAFHLLLGFAENQIIFWKFKIRNIIWMTEVSANGDSDNRGSTVYIYMCVCDWAYENQPCEHNLHRVILLEAEESPLNSAVVLKILLQ